MAQTWAAALPGKVLAVDDQQLASVTQVFLTPDGHAQERTLFAEVLASVQADDLWIADRNFCTLGLRFGIHVAKAAVVLRQHGIRKVAAHVRPAAYATATRGPKKPPPKGTYRNGGHVSTHKLLQEQRNQ